MLNPLSSICWNMIKVVIIFLKWKFISDLHLNQFIEEKNCKIGLELIGTFRPHIEKRWFYPLELGPKSVQCILQSRVPEQGLGSRVVRYSKHSSCPVDAMAPGSDHGVLSFFGNIPIIFIRVKVHLPQLSTIG